MVLSSETVRQSYDNLKGMCEEISTLSEILGLMGWDEQVMMPTGSVNARGKQKAVLTSLIHTKSTSPDLKAAIDNAKHDMSTMNEFERAVVRDAEREYERAVRVPTQLERDTARHETDCLQAWVVARKSDDYKGFESSLKKMLQLAKEKALAIQPDKNVFDTRIDMFERGMSAQRLKSIFDQIETPLKSILKRTLDAKSKCTRKVHPALLGGEQWTVEKQKALSDDFCHALGFNFEKGRIDESVHPFTGGAGPTDVRITTRYSTELPFEGILAAVHEVGHSLYEQGRNEKYANLPVSEALSMGVHESQSLFWERMVAQNERFWEAMMDKVHNRLEHTADVTANDMFFAVNQVNPGLIRVEADELTYPFHIIVRFDLERRLLEGELSIEDLPRAWSASMKEYLGVDVPNDSQGCLQDVHWPSGAFGYFPSYSLGAMMAAQLFHHLKTSVLTDIEELIGKADFSAIREWLRTNIHEKGSLYASLDELLVNVTGEVLNPEYYIDYLDAKYAEVYVTE